MHTYDISKYDPDYYAEDGRYMKEDWIAIGDIGKLFDGVALTDKEYMRIEDAYIETIDMALELHSVDYLFVKNFKRNFKYDTFRELTKSYYHLYSVELLEFYKNYSGGQASRQDILKLCRLQLREDVWSEMYYPRRIKVRIGYDYLLGIDSSRSLDRIIPNVERLGLFIYEVVYMSPSD